MQYPQQPWICFPTCSLHPHQCWQGLHCNQLACEELGRSNACWTSPGKAAHVPCSQDVLPIEHPLLQSRSQWKMAELSR